MIVSCPACRTRYRYPEPVPATGARAVCSQCQSVVPLVPSSPAYVVRARAVAVPVGAAVGVPVGAAVGVAVGVGADLPGPASGMGSLEVGAPATEVPAASPAPASMPAPSDFSFDQPVEFPSEPAPPPTQTADAFDLGAAAPAEAPAQATAEARPAKKPRKARRVGTGRRILHLLVLLVLAGAGAAAGEYATMVGWLGPVAVHPSVEPVRLGIIGGLLGVLIAWAGIRWTTPKS